MGAAVLAELRRQGHTVAARKPAQSFAADDPVHERDAAVLAAATGEPVADVCPAERSYPVPMAPPMAADVLGVAPPTLEGLVAGITWPDPEPEVRWVELVGGRDRRSPSTATGSTSPGRFVPTASCWSPTPASAPSTRWCCRRRRSRSSGSSRSSS